MEGESSEAHLADYLQSLTETPGRAVPPFGPWESSTYFYLPQFHTQFPYLESIK